ncbi:MAG: M3 family oligoendopeptidase [Sedimentisphaerales bacterium]|nr:M3 family oligoendopeptidase [Sedimentisphaerales bacterium]
MSSEIYGPNVDNLQPFTPRQFVPGCCDLTNPITIKELYRRLLDKEIKTAQDLERFLLNRSELSAAIGQVSSLLHVLMTCKTDDANRCKAYQDFVENVEPVLKPLEDELDRKYLAARKLFPDQYGHYKVHDEHLATDIELFRTENIDLSTKESLLCHEFQKITGAQTVEFEGQEKTLPQMGKYLLENDRVVREQAWRAISGRRLKDADALDKNFDKLFQLRQKFAQNCGYDNFRDLRFKQWYRTDYTPADCRAFHKAVEELVVPLNKQIYKRRASQMGLQKLRPWDTSCDPLGRSPLKPFDHVDELINGCERIFNQLDSELGQQFTQMKNDGLLDLASRKGKAPGGYQATISEARKPFIFMNAVGTHNDLVTLLHEGGHAFHTFACRHLDPISYRHAPMEFCEVASMSMELLAYPYLGEFYSEEEVKRAKVEHLERIIDLLGWIATVDCFQHELYENPQLDIEGRHTLWQQVRSRFDTGEIMDYDGLEKEQKYQWHRQLHIFLYPLYYMEYGIAQLGSLGIWLQARKDPQTAMTNYKNALALGGSRTLAELFRSAGLNFGMDLKNFEPLIRLVQEEIGL